LDETLSYLGLHTYLYIYIYISGIYVYT
jgi:hypothetical protein